jgi:glycosyltransferase involved in cell wall biosynthesis
MRIGLDASILQIESTRVRGIGQYIQNLFPLLLKHDTVNEYLIYTAKSALPLEPARDRLQSGRNRISHLPDIPLLAGCFPKKSVRKHYYNFLVQNHVVLPARILLDKVDLVHFPAQAGAPLIQPKISIVTLFDAIFHLYPDRYQVYFEQKMRAKLQSIAVKKADMIITISETSKRDIHNVYGIPLEKIRVTYLGANEYFKPVDPKAAGDFLLKKYDLPGRFLLYVGGFDFRKNLPILVRALKQLRMRTGFSNKLVLVGKVPGHPKIPGYRDFAVLRETIRDLNLDDQVLIPGYVPEEDLPMFYSAADVFVFPSLYEGFGLPVLEAMACGAPVIAQNSSSIPEVLGDAGILVDSADFDNALVRALEDLLADSSRRQLLRERGLERVKKFSWQKTALETLKIYEECYQLHKS